MRGVGLDVGNGIAESDSRPLILSGPPVGGDPPMLPAAQTGPHEPDVPYTVGGGEPIARMSTPEYMRGGSNIRAMAPERANTNSDLEDIVRSQGGRAEIVTNRWDPSEGIIDRHMATMDEESSSFV
jgi:hypothetical protein